jgi:hypothetical protein
MGEDLRGVGNRRTLRRLASGMEITRAVKHEPIAFDRLTASQLTRLTDDRHGSKFLPEWTMARLVDWLEQQIELQDWRFPPGVRARVHVRLDDPVGYVRGRLVHTITITASGRWVHAYPDEDAHE